jgi:2-polyprenyl-6-methoxyphenol hydroxylase-like FAD-dependent oxidoreductase
MDTHVLIVGAGPTGLVLACDLARRGVPFRIIEKAPAFFTGSRGKGLQPRTLEVLDDLGVIDAVLAEAAPYPPIRRYANGSVIWEGRMHEPAEPTPEVPYPNILMLPQARTEELLRHRLAELGGTVELGVELTGFEQDATGVTATLSTGPVRAAYLVGADGGRSTVRKRLGVGFEGETYETERMLVGDVRVDGLDRDHWHAWVTSEESWVALCPLPGTDAFQFVAPVDADTEPALTLETVESLVANPALRLHDLTWLSLYRANIRMVDRFRAGRVFLAGDAAHVHSPAGGQGLNTGIQDAYNLGWKLALGGDALLDTYEEERLPVAADVLGLSTRLHNSRSQRRGAETRQLGITYRGASLAAEPWDGPVQPGDRAPDGPLPDGSRRFDAFRGPHFTLLATAEISLPHHDLVHVHRVGDAYGARFALVRPDGYVGVLTDTAERVIAYLATAGLPPVRESAHPVR